jgi:chemotaxis-related protein WspD
VAGLINVRGELVVCVSLARLLGGEKAEAAAPLTCRTASERLLVVHRDDLRVAFAVDEVHGLERLQSRDLSELPASVARAAVRYSKAVAGWKGQSIGILDDRALFSALDERLP